MPHRVEHARAKLNLTLRVLRRRADGWHDIESLTVFAGLADRLEIHPAENLSLELRGPFAAEIPSDGANSVLQARAGFARRENARRRKIAAQGRIVLEKRIPPAAGLGGGSSDAAAMLRALAGLHGGIGAQAEAELALSLGSDVPVCLHNQPAMMRGRGERIEPVAALPRAFLLLAKPEGRLTAEQVYQRWDETAQGAEGQGGNPAAGMNLAELVDWCRQRPNGLQTAAIGLLPEIGHVLDALQASDGCLLARMSGSGPACFGVYANAEAAQQARQRLAALYPRWWLHEDRLA